MINLYDIHLNRETKNWGGSEWVVDGEDGRETYPGWIEKDDAKWLYRNGEPFDPHTFLIAQCSCCGKIGAHRLTDEETEILYEYEDRGREMGYLQDLFPNVPAWIRSGAIDKYSDGFCICPECADM